MKKSFEKIKTGLVEAIKMTEVMNENERLRAELAKATEDRDKYKEIAISETNETGKLQLSNIDSLAQITRLRAELAAVTEERDRMREALRPIAFMARAIPVGINGREKADYQTVDVTCGDLRRARAALEGVTEKKGAGNE